MDTNELWSKVLKGIESEISRASFGTWFRNTGIEKIEDHTVYVNVPNTFVKDWLINKYHKIIMKYLRENLEGVRVIEYLISSKINIKNKKENIEKVKITNNYNLGLDNLYINKENNLNPKYKFDNFIVGSFNEIAYAAGQAVIKNPGVNYNPLYIYGETGLGKTHLIQAIGNVFNEKHENKKAFYTTSERFSNEYVNSVLNNKGGYFKEKYRKYDMLIIDDVQFFSNKEKTQEELFHLFNIFYENNKQIIFSSDKPPKFIQNIEDRLRSRFEGGMIVDVNKPDFESRLAILKNKASLINLNIKDEILEYIASAVQDNIRELEGNLNIVNCQSQVKKREITLSEVKILIKNNIKPQRNISIKEIINIVADFYNIEEKNLFTKTRRKEFVHPRQVVMYLLREDFNTSYPYIGQKLGGRDHTTVIHAYEKVKNAIKDNQNFQKEIESLRGIINNYQRG